MRTTLDIDDDILTAAKEIARRRRTSAGKVLSELARDALRRDISFTVENGFPVIPVQPEALPVTLETVNRLRDESS
jgi:hypothetical protein